MVMMVCSWRLLVRGEGRAPEITVTNPARFDDLENIFFVGRMALPLAYMVT